MELNLIEFGVTSDLQWVSRVHRSKAKYAELVRRLRRAGWNVGEEVEVVTAGVRATVPKRNKGALEGLGVDTGKARKALQEAMVGITAWHVDNIVGRYRRLEGKVKRGVSAGGKEDG